MKNENDKNEADEGNPKVNFEETNGNTNLIGERYRIDVNLSNNM